jgi:hypothetical protein
MVKYIDQKESILTGLKDLSNLFLKIKENKKNKDLIIVLKDRNIVIKNYCIIYNYIKLFYII